MILYLVNLALLLMLVAATAYMVMVNRRLRALKSGQDEIGPTVQSFAKVTAEMTDTVKRLSTDAATITKNLEGAIARAEKVHGDINRMLAGASVEAKILARNRSRMAGDASQRDGAAPAFRERNRERGGGAADAGTARKSDAERWGQDAPSRSEGDIRRLATAESEHTLAVTAAWPAEKQSDRPKRCRPWMPRRATDENLRADAMQVFYGEPESA